METPTLTLPKVREIVFHPLQDASAPAQQALLDLGDLPGIHRLDVLGPSRLLVGYHLPLLTYRHLESLLRDKGYHLDNSLMCKLRRALWIYSEDTELANLGCPDGQCKTTRDVFIHAWRQRPHGCRDPRPKHWRHYL